MSASQIVSVPLDRLSPVANGVRKTNGVSVESLAASIRAEGLLQNLTVVRDAESRLLPVEHAKFVVIAGSRRLRALRSLAERNDLPADFQVPCRIVDETDALSASLAENAIREQMHPADEFMAFREMHNQGRTIEDIAARFGVTPLVVQRRLKLANVSPKLFELFRTTNEINLEQMMALAISDDHKAQETAWFKAPQWQRRAEELKRALTKKEISFTEDSVAKFVGRKEYEASGGAVHADLFGSNDAGYATDAKLLRMLAATKLDSAADDVRKEGWSWVEVRPEISYSDLLPFHKNEPSGHQKPTDLDKKRIAELTKERGPLDVKIEALREAEQEDSEEWDALCERHRGISDEIRQLQKGKETWDPKILAKTGAIVTTERGQLKIFRGLSKTRLAPASSKGATNGEKKKPATAHSDALIQELTSRVSLAMRVELIANADMAIIALTHRLATPKFWPGAGLYDHPVKISPEGRYQVKGFEAADCVDVAKLEQHHAEWKARLPKKAEELFAWLISPSNRPQIIPLLAYCIAGSIDVVALSERERGRRGEFLADALKLDMTSRWTPKADSYLTRVAAPQVLAAMTECGSDKVEIAAAGKMRKAELATKALPILAQANWVPKPLRFAAKPTAPQEAKKAPKASKLKPAKAKKGARA